MSERGTYGRSIVGADGAPRGPSLVTLLLVGGAVLWARHQSNQIARLNAAVALPHQSFTADLRDRAREMSHRFKGRLGLRKDV
jgi:hypothetical protein